MSYVAIARRYRPNSFDEMAGQTHVTQTLRNAILRDRVHHAYLFSGPRGVGKTTTARALARALNCEQGPTPDPCGTCIYCQEILAGNSSAVTEIDGASNNKVDNARTLQEDLQYIPNGRIKVIIIDEVHMLSKAAFNALLKTLEEPPPHVKFIFATTEPNALPDTILSRCQRFEFKRIPMSTVVGHLKYICEQESIQIDDGGLRLIARAGEGSMRDSQSLLDQVISFAGKEIKTPQVAAALGLVDRALLYQMLRGLVTHDATACLDAINQVYDAGYDLTEFTAEMLELLRNATLVVLSKESFRFVDIPEDERQELDRLSTQSTPDVFTRSFQVMLDVHEQVSRSPRPKLVLEMSVAKLVAIRPAHSIDDLVSKITKMQGGGTPRQKPTAAGKDSDDESHAAKPLSSGFLPSSASKNASTSASVSKNASTSQNASTSSASFLPPSKTSASSTVEQAKPSETKDFNLNKKKPLFKPGEGVSPKDSTSTTLGRSTSSSPVKPIDSRDLPANEKFWLFHDYLKQHGRVEHDVIATVAFESIDASRIHFVAPSDFNIPRLNKLREDDFFLDTLAHFFNVRNFSVHLRKDFQQTETPNERQERLNEEKRQRLREYFEQETFFQTLQKQFSASISSIKLGEDAPLHTHPPFPLLQGSK